jgi:hypothetical protein
MLLWMRMSDHVLTRGGCCCCLLFWEIEIEITKINAYIYIYIYGQKQKPKIDRKRQQAQQRQSVNVNVAKATAGQNLTWCSQAPKNPFIANKFKSESHTQLLELVTITMTSSMWGSIEYIEPRPVPLAKSWLFRENSAIDVWELVATYLGVFVRCWGCMTLC